jgi:hypothetical protein
MNDSAGSLEQAARSHSHPEGFAYLLSAHCSLRVTPHLSIDKFSLGILYP